MASAYGGAMPRIRMHVPVHTYARVDVNVCIAPCKRTRLVRLAIFKSFYECLSMYHRPVLLEPSK